MTAFFSTSLKAKFNFYFDFSGRCGRVHAIFMVWNVALSLGKCQRQFCHWGNVRDFRPKEKYRTLSSVPKSVAGKFFYQWCWTLFFSCCMVVLSYGETQSLVVEQQHGVDKGWDTAHQQLCGDPTGKRPNLPSLSHICFRPWSPTRSVPVGELGLQRLVSLH